MSKPIKVISITLSTRGAPAMVIGALSENALHVIDLQTLPASIPKLRKHLDTVLGKLAAAGETVSVFIEDPTGLLTGSGGYHLRLDDKTSDGRPLLAVAMERYRALSALGGLIYPKGGDGNLFQISASIMNIKISDTGRAIYEIDWENLKDGSRALLLLIYGAMCQGPMQADYLNRLFDNLNSPRSASESGPLSAFVAMTAGYDIQLAGEFPASAKHGVTL